MAAFGRRVGKLALGILLLFVVGITNCDEDAYARQGHREKRAAVDRMPKKDANANMFVDKSQELGGGLSNFRGGNNHGAFVPKQNNAPVGGDRLGFKPNPQQGLPQGGLPQKRFQGGQQQFGQNGAVNMHRGPKRPHQLRLAETTECGADVQKYCARTIWEKNFMVLDCLQNDPDMDEKLSDDCQHFLWNYKRNLTMDDRFDHASQEMCTKELQNITECQGLEIGSGQIIPCLIEHFEDIKTSVCQQFLNKMAAIVFSDYRLIFHFANACADDINKLKCGRLEGNHEEQMIHSQGRTLACLAEQMTKLKDECKLQVLRTYELQSDDFHLDRPLYYACRDDREKFCSKVSAGGGKVFDCLYKSLSSSSLSAACREKLELRQQLTDQDVKIDKVFYKTCKKDIENNDCLSGSNNEHTAKRAYILLCLENAAKKGKKLRGKCLSQMENVRRIIMEDFKVSPDLVAACATELQQYCIDREIGGETLHCLMGLAKRDSKHPISAECKAQVGKLLQEADIDSDIRIDPALQKACHSVIDRVCNDVPQGEGGVMTCLMENIDSDDMTTKCEEKLLEVQYFIMRDFRLDSQMFRRCRQFARDLCFTSGNWHEVDDDMTRQNAGQVLACLFRQLRRPKQADKKISRACKQEIKRVMKARALSVNLNPEIEDACLKDLGEHCSDDKFDTEIGAEMECLQENYDDLSPKCKKVVGDLIEEEDEDVELDHILMRACTPMIKRFCDELLDSDAEPGDVLECLIEHKNNHAMDAKCAAGVEHHQLISQKEFKFNHKFKEACEDAVRTFCKERNTKADIVACLSEHVRNATLYDKDHTIKKACRQQLRLQILQRSETIELDPALKKTCKADIANLCADVASGNAAVTECLKKRAKKLTDPCHKLLFQRQKAEFAIADYGLLSSCKKMIKTYCDPDDDQMQIFRCLKKNKNNPDFDSRCRSIVLRREVLQSKDFRLNPSLLKACHPDIAKYCAGIVEQFKKDNMLEGRVISCLKKQYAVKHLSQECEVEIAGVVRDAAGDIREAPVLEKACLTEISKHCHDFIVESDGSDEEIHEAGRGKVGECLKEKLIEKKLKDPACIKEVSYLIQEEEIDINVDPILKQGCQRELTRLCRGVRSGEGRLMSCLLSLLEDDPKSLSKKCKDLLQKRKDMWEYAAQVAPIEGFQEIIVQITESPAKLYIIGVLGAIICLIFFFGIGCGRVTKRVRAEMKNK